MCSDWATPRPLTRKRGILACAEVEKMARWMQSRLKQRALDRKDGPTGERPAELSVSSGQLIEYPWMPKHISIATS